MARVTDLLYAKRKTGGGGGNLPISPWRARTSQFQGSAETWGARGIAYSVYNGNNFFISTDGLDATGSVGTTVSNWTESSSYNAAWTFPGGVSGLFLKDSDIFATGSGITAAHSDLRYSTDNGATWATDTGLSTSGYTGTSSNLVVWSGTKMLVGGPAGRVSTSATGLGAGWTHGTVGGAWGATDVKAGIWDAGRGQFVIVGTRSGIHYCATSPDGVTWTDQPGLDAAWPGANAIQAISTDGTKYVVVGDGGRCVVSTDGGVIWTNATTSLSNAIGVGNEVTVINWNGAQWLATGPNAKIVTSPDGLTWTFQFDLRTTAYGTTNSVFSISWDGSQYLATGGDGALATSPDGITWTFNSGLNPSMGTSIVYSILMRSSGLAIAVGEVAKVNVSEDYGATWLYYASLLSTVGGQTMYDIISTGTSSAMTIGANSTCAVTSDNGVTWTDRTAQLKTAWTLNQFGYSLATDGSTIVAVGAGGAIAHTTDDGATWTDHSTVTSDNLRKVIWTGAPLNKFVAVGDNGTCVTSSDGVTWTLGGLIAGGIERINSVDYNGTTLVAVGNSGTCATSSNGGTTWSDQSTAFQTAFGEIFPGTYAGAKAIKWDSTNNLFFVVGEVGKAASSSDGVTWTDQASTAISAQHYGTATMGASMNNIVVDAGKYIVIGSPSGSFGQCVISP